MFRFRFAGLILVMGILLLASTAQSTLAQNAQNQGDGIGTPQYKTIPYVYPVHPYATTIPFWASSFTYDNQIYPYMMVGTDPSKGPATSTVPTEIIPLNFVFANGVALDGSSKTDLTVASPIFQTAHFDTGTTQYGDAIQRASFWQTGGSADYHVLLGQPRILATETIDVPPSQGQEFTGSQSGAPIGLINYSWFVGQLNNLMGQRKVDPQTTPIFLTYDTFLYDQSPNNCCVLGFHGAMSAAVNGNGKQPIQTLIYAAYSDPGIFGGAPYIQDIHALSHEVSEFMADPFVNNVVPPWSIPTAPQYGCTNYLEVGDPVVGIGFEVKVNHQKFHYQYHPEDEVFFSWFARESPSRGYNGQYTYLDTFKTVAPGC